MSEFRSGFVAVVGRPNVGKSTLLNSLIGDKVVIVANKPQTTRNKIRCILTREDAQVVFLDTPGIHKPKNKLGEHLVEVAKSSIGEVDAVLLVVDGAAGLHKGDQYIANELAHVSTPVAVAVNKMDKVDDDLVEQQLDQFRPLGHWPQFPISALKGDNLESLVNHLVDQLPEGPQYYPDDYVIDHPEQFVVTELVREQVLHLTRDEVPHSVAVVMEDMKAREDKDLIDIRCTIYVERNSQKGIIIGRQGAMLKAIGQNARGSIERLLGSPVFLDLWVKVRKDWREQAHLVRQMGYKDE